LFFARIKRLHLCTVGNLRRNCFEPLALPSQIDSLREHWGRFGESKKTAELRIESATRWSGGYCIWRSARSRRREFRSQVYLGLTSPLYRSISLVEFFLSTADWSDSFVQLWWYIYYPINGLFF